MRKKFDEKYWKISKYVILTFAIMCGSWYLISFIASLFSDIGGMFTNINSFLGKMFSIFSPVLVAFIIAYLLDPVVDLLQGFYEKKASKYLQNRKETDKKAKSVLKRTSKKKGTDDNSVVDDFVKDEPQFKRRTAGTALLYLIIIIVLSVIIAGIINSINFSKSPDEPFAKYISSQITNAVVGFSNTYALVLAKLREWNVEQYFQGFFSYFLSFINNFGASLANFVASLGNGLFTFFIAFVMAFYILRDKASFLNKTNILMDTFIPEKINKGIKSFFSIVHGIFSGYIRGQLTDASIYGALIAIVLSIIGIPYGAVIGILSGFFNLIPYVGAIIGFTLAIIAGLFSGNPILALYASISILVIQQIDTLYIGPKVVGESVELSPFLVLVALALGGALFGLGGMLFAVPVTATLKILIGIFIEKQRKTHSIKDALTSKEYNDEL